MKQRFDLIVIGSGPAGEKGAAQAAYFGKRVAVVECAPEPGGAGVHTGTLPSKTLREAALFLSGQRARALYGVSASSSAHGTLERLMARKQAICDSEARRIRDNLRDHGVHYVEGRARLRDAHTVCVQGPSEAVELQADFLLIATGSRPFHPPGIDFAHDRVHDSDEILTITELPRSLSLVGAGVIGCEYACMFAALGTEVTLLDARTTLLPFLDREISARLASAMQALGVRMRLGEKWHSVQADSEGVTLRLEDGSELRAAHHLHCAGRVGVTSDLGLPELGIAVDARGYVQVNDELRTTVPSVFAAGDVIGPPGLASAAMEQGRVAVCRAFGFEYKQAVSNLVPAGIYTIPAVSAVGETEQSCAHRNLSFVVGRAPYANNARAKIIGDEQGLLKLVVSRPDRKLLGVHVIGERATELVHVGQAVIALGGTIDVFVDMVWNYPTLSEIYKYAAYDALRALSPTTSSVRT